MRKLLVLLSFALLFACSSNTELVVDVVASDSTHVSDTIVVIDSVSVDSVIVVDTIKVVE